MIFFNKRLTRAGKDKQFSKYHFCGTFCFMTHEAISQYSKAIQARRNGIPSKATAKTPFETVKPEFYADSRMLIDDVRETYTSYREKYPPYGLITPDSEIVTGFNGSKSDQWLQVEFAMATTAIKAFNETVPKATSCPYHEALRNLGKISLFPVDENLNGIDGLREVIVPGATFAPATIVNLLRRIPAMVKETGATDSLEKIALNSKSSLLKELLSHPQQLTKPFTFCLSKGYKDRDVAMLRESFLPDDLIAEYVQVQIGADGKERLGWAKSTLDFKLRAEVKVPDRIRGSETDLDGDHVTTYPIGTPLGDIKVTEPTIGCPGNQMAYDMWNQTVEVAVQEELWDESTT